MLLSRSCWLVPTLLLSLGAIPAHAQGITPERSTIVTPAGNQIQITGGARSANGANLFHSFSQFNVAPEQIINFLTPAQTQNVLSRVTGGSPSVVNGLLQVSGSNANLYLINPAGIVFGRNASLNVPAAFTATTATGINLGGNWFSSLGSNDYSNLGGSPSQFAFGSAIAGSIVNTGNLSVSPQQSLQLIGGSVINTGTLVAPGGNVVLTAVPGTSLVRLSQPGRILSLEIDPRRLDGAALTPQTLPQLLSAPEVRSAAGLTTTDRLVETAGTSVPARPRSAIASGLIDVSGSQGGRVQILGRRVALVDARVDASGDQGGGRVFIGGNYRGRGPMPTALRTYIDRRSQINADSRFAGNGGRVIVWSDQVTAFYGLIQARGAYLATSPPPFLSNGGFVEVSGREQLLFRGSVDLRAPFGQLGTLLLDPRDIRILSGEVDDDYDQLDSDLTISEILTLPLSPPFDQLFTISQANLEEEGTNGNVILQATNNITVEPLANGSLDFRGGIASDISFIADSDRDGNGSFTMLGRDTILTGGANLTIRGANINLHSVDTRFFTDAAGSPPGTSGNIELAALRDITIGGNLLTSGNVGNGGRVQLRSSSGSIVVQGNIDSTSPAGRGGGVNLVAQNTLQVGAINTSSLSGNGGDVFLQSLGAQLSAGRIQTSATSGNGGNIDLSAQTAVGSDRLDSSSSSGNAGRITVSSQQGPITITEIDSRSSSGNPGPVDIASVGNLTLGGIQGGSAVLSSTLGEIGVGPVVATTLEFAAQEQVTTAEITTTNQVTLTSANAGISTETINAGGETNLRARGAIATGNIIAPSIDLSGNSINASNVFATNGQARFRATQDINLEFAIGRGVELLSSRGGVRVRGTRDQASIISQGPVTIQSATPFGIGSTNPNGTAGAIVTDITRLNPPQSIPGSLTQGNITINSGTPQPSPTPPVSPRLPRPTPSASPSPTPSPSPTASPPARPSPSPRPRRSPSPVSPAPSPAPIGTAPRPPQAEPPRSLSPVAVEPPPVNFSASRVVNDTALVNLERDFSQEYIRHLNLSTPVRNLSTAEIRQVLSGIEAKAGVRSALVYVFFTEGQTKQQSQSQLEVMLVTAQGEVIRNQIPVSRSLLIRTANEFRSQVTNVRQPRAFLPSSRQLYNWLIAPIEPQLKAQGIQNIAFVLDGGLRSLPLAALHDGQGFIIDRYSIGLMPSLSLTNTTYRDLRSTQVLAMGAESFTEQTPLPAVPVELAAITRQIWPGQSFLNNDFTLKNLQTQPQQQSFGIIHLATHAAFLPGDMSNSFIQLWDTRLGLDQMPRMGWQNLQVDLLVLSACQTALGDEQAELGFAGMAVKSGVSAAIASLWQVSDEGTLGLMLEFYRNLRRTSTKSEALRQAQLAMARGEVRLAGGKLVTSSGVLDLPPALANLDDRVFSHPYFWSAFTAIGNPW